VQQNAVARCKLADCGRLLKNFDRH
jgi:hypothetical protein